MSKGYDRVVSKFNGKRFLACAAISIDVKNKKISGDPRSIDEIVESYSDEELEKLLDVQYINELIENNNRCSFYQNPLN